MQQQSSSDQVLTLNLGRTVAAKVIAKATILLLLSGTLGYFYSYMHAKSATKANTISTEVCAQNPCLKEVTEYKALLNKNKAFVNPVVTIPMVAFSLTILFGMYELFALLLGLIVRKIIR